MATLVKAGRFIDGTGAEARENQYIVIENGRVARVFASMPQGDFELLDFGGSTVMPGLINCHVHIDMPPVADANALLSGASDAEKHLIAIDNLSDYIKTGVTYVRSLGSPGFVDVQLRDAAQKKPRAWPGIVAAGPIICMTGGHGWRGGMQVDGADEARKAARTALRDGADCVKFAATGGVMTKGVEPGSQQLTLEEMAAICAEARKAGKRTATHAQGSSGILDAVRAGVTSIEHGFYLTDEILELMAEKGTWLVPTLAAPYNIVKHGIAGGIPEYMVRKSEKVVDLHVESFRRALAAGIKIAAGTDAGTPFNEHTETWFELKLMREAGMDAMRSIVSATGDAAKLLGIDADYGTLEAGKLADFIVLAGDPVADVTALRAVEAVYKHGEKLLP